MKLKTYSWVMNAKWQIGWVYSLHDADSCFVDYGNGLCSFELIKDLQIIELIFKGWAE